MRILRWKAVHDKVQLGRTTAWRLEQQGKFPKRFKIGPNSVGWLEADIDEFVRAARDAGRQQ